MYQMQLEERQMKSNGMACFKELESHLSHLYHKNLFHEVITFKMAFLRFFDEDYENFRKMMLRNLDQLRLQFDRKPLHANNAKICLKKLQTQLQEFFDSEAVTSSQGINPGYQEFFKDYTGCKPETYRSNLLVHLDILEKFIEKSVLNYGEIRMKENEVKEIKETDKPLNEAIPYEHEIGKSFKLQSKDVQINLVQAVDANFVVTKSSGTKLDKQDTSSTSGNDANTKDAVIRPVNDQEPLAEV
ncbi:hypothetical protein Tco_1070803 [Tanacetum coccineum]|uniref:Uncharacterized protein n=1 Tax=Tanacetum coccineum TaxID=301880 RepID=A0ABQ5HMM0_9ASTR